MKSIIVGNDANAWVCARKLAELGGEVVVVTGSGQSGVSSILPSGPLAPSVATELGLGVSLSIVGRTGVSPDGREVGLKIRRITGDVTERDVERWPSFVTLMNNASEIWRSLFLKESGSNLATRWREFGRRQAMEVLRVPCQSLSELLDDWFESDLLKATLAVAALRGSRQGPFAPGSAFLLLQRWARGEVFGRSKIEHSQLQEAAKSAGVAVVSQEPDRFVVETGKVVSLRLVSGEEVVGETYITSEDAATTMERRVGFSHLDPETIAKVSHWDTRSYTAVARFEPTDRWDGAMISFCGSLEELERAYDPTKYGGTSSEPYGELDSASGLLYLQYVAEDTDEKARAFGQKYKLGELKESYSPTQLADQFGITGGHLFGGEKSLWQSYALREQFDRPLSNLFLCGASTGPGDYSGVAGLMCARKLTVPVMS